MSQALDESLRLLVREDPALARVRQTNPIVNVFAMNPRMTASDLVVILDAEIRRLQSELCAERAAAPRAVIGYLKEESSEPAVPSPVPATDIPEYLW